MKLEQNLKQNAEKELQSLHDIYRPVSGWLDAPDDIQPSLERSETADVIVVGGGFAGLSAALELKSLGADVILLEAHFAGFGASGRNAGVLVGAQNLNFGLAKRIGKEKTKKIVDFYQEAVSFVERRIGEWEIGCDYNASGVIAAGVHPSQESSVRKQLEAIIEYGIPARFLDYDEMRARGLPAAFLFGRFTETGGTLDPGKYVSGLRRAALRAGVRIFENSPVLSFRDGGTVFCKTASGMVEAPQLILATNAQTPKLGLLAEETVAIRASLIETEPLSSDQLNELGWPNREGISTHHNIMESYRLTGRNTLVAGMRMKSVFGHEMPNEAAETEYRSLQVVLADRFPSLRSHPIRAGWTGYAGYAWDGVSLVGDISEAGNIHYVAGCSGRGVAAHSFIGHLLAEKINGTEHKHLTALRREHRKVPTAALRWGKMASLFSAAHLLDQNLNRRLRRASR